MDLFGDLEPTHYPDGFAYAPELITPEEEAALASRFAALPFEPFRFRGVEARRRVVNFGRLYDGQRGRLMDAEPIPEWLLPVRDRAAGLAGLPPHAIVHVLINEYRPGAPIGWHRDRPVFDQIIGVSMLSPATMRFRRRVGGAFERRSVTLAPRSAYVLTGPARDEWEHSLPEATAHRYSITFRSLRR
ncbi:MAG: alpha-ketoglutarate-dependent dioxygenase AlkB [Phenylobacterium sp.]|nr:alpha-ketoglutarate-dependent dioxygenase AlkB [Phenylobacterium sp.]